MRRSVTRVGLLIGLTLLAMAGCAQRGLPAPEPQATPYTGPLRVEPPETGPDRSAGAAGLAVRCRTAPVGHNRFTDKHEGGSTPRLGPSSTVNWATSSRSRSSPGTFRRWPKPVSG